MFFPGVSMLETMICEACRWSGLCPWNPEGFEPRNQPKGPLHSCGGAFDAHYDAYHFVHKKSTKKQTIYRHRASNTQDI